MEQGRISISIKDVELGYSPSNPLLPKFSVDAHLGELIALVGRNGIGKSTLLRSIIGLQQPLCGEIQVEGTRSSALMRKQRAKALSFVPADPVRVANLYIRDFVAVGRFPHLNWSRALSPSDWEMVDYALTLVGINHLAHRDITTVSDGERQRAMIAFALAQDTRIIILDEPTAFLDLPNKFEMVRLLSNLAHTKGKTIVYSTHDLQGAIHEADTIWMMLNSGLASGAPEDLALSNSFQNLLADTHVVFDGDSGLFRNYRKPTRYVALEGNGNVRLWTARMLERIGFDTENPPLASVKVNCVTDNNSPCWMVTEGENLVFKAYSLGDLAKKMRAL
ncbi:MAG: ABC transporter ATP-binding protein [Tenuifilaceae bacterium]|nr:ABC transporter ATP-binding protein [Tenuifilaceae bacterium]